MAAPLTPLTIGNISIGDLLLYNETPGFDGATLSMGFVVRQLSGAEQAYLGLGETAWQTVFPENSPPHGVAAFSKIVSVVKAFFSADMSDLNAVAVAPGPNPYGAG